mmetsp:Transcript_26687/g.58847  ORF Transcript_26687/g.58847 Transcript_26687/m.58847 type:complete len:110 (-) Transcript_26687:71-400(-)
MPESRGAISTVTKCSFRSRVPRDFLLPAMRALAPRRGGACADPIGSPRVGSQLGTHVSPWPPRFRVPVLIYFGFSVGVGSMCHLQLDWCKDLARLAVWSPWFLERFGFS